MQNIDSYEFLYNRLCKVGPDQFAQEIHLNRYHLGHNINKNSLMQYLNNATNYALDLLVNNYYTDIPNTNTMQSIYEAIDDIKHPHLQVASSYQELEHILHN